MTMGTSHALVLPWKVRLGSRPSSVPVASPIHQLHPHTSVCLSYLITPLCYTFYPKSMFEDVQQVVRASILAALGPQCRLMCSLMPQYRTKATHVCSTTQLTIAQTRRADVSSGPALPWKVRLGSQPSSVPVARLIHQLHPH